MQDVNTTQLYAIAAAIPVLLYNGKRGAFSLKYFFYISYPAHMLLLYAIHYVLGKSSIAILNGIGYNLMKYCGT